MAQQYLTLNPSETIDKTVGGLHPDKVLIVTDINVEREVLPLLRESGVVAESPRIAIPAGESGKNIETVTKVWHKLGDIGATRQSLVLNIGGGVVSDLGGFAAATFKRGIRTVNLPTTLLGAVDAATGGKTGIDFRGLKNEIGAFHLPEKVIVSPLPFATLPQREILSGYAEMVKTALFSDRNFYINLMDMEKVVGDNRILGEAVEKCVRIKDEIVAQDPLEKGLRKVLNLGHTAGHAFESLRIRMGLEVTHGQAVAHGLLVALILSHIKLGFDSNEVYHYRNFLRKYYGSSLMRCEDMEYVMEKMNNDKKNLNYGTPLFTLLKSIGEPEINVAPTGDEIRQALEIYQDYLS
ncbi:MAG: 3-dehydroquinate synthase [Muribaculaceae bacterium]|nr:3-dehydroquinate synthase [Muribaculaceae bacterium]